MSNEIETAKSMSAAQVGTSEWAQVLARKPKRPLWPRVALVGALAVVALIFSVTLHGEPEPTPREEVTISALGNARWKPLGNGVIELASGKLIIRTEQPLTLISEDVTVELSRGRFLAERTDGHFSVLAEEGEATARTASGTTAIQRGQPFSWQAPVETNALDVQTELFERGRHEAPAQAIETWRESLRKFPDGVLHPEVRFALFDALWSEGRFAEAREVARELDEKCPNDSRLTRVHLRLKK